MEKKEARLKVMEALREEAYRGIVRIDSQTMHDIEVRPGDIVEIEGGRKTVGIIDRAYPTDVGQSVIRMDGILRRNAKTGLGEYLKIRKVDIKEAKSVTIAPAQKYVEIQVSDTQMFKRSLLGRAIVKGDQVALGGARNRRTTMMGGNFEDIFDLFERGMDVSFPFGGLQFVVVNTDPKQAVIIAEETNLIISPKRPDILEEKIVEVTYEDLGGLNDEIKKIRELVELPLKHPEVFERLGIQPPKGVLLHGSPGTGKTLLAKAVANETSANFIHIDGPSIMSKYVGEAEKKIRDLFAEAEKNSPSIIFIDEIDAIAPKREESYSEVERRVVAQLLAVMDGLKSRGKVVVIGATNRPNALDSALRRPGRFDREIEIGVPKYEGRLQIFKIHTRDMPLAKDVKLEEIAKITHGFVGADLEALCKESAMIVLRRLLPDFRFKKDEPIEKEILEKLIINMSSFKEALKVVRPSALREVLVEVPNVKWDDIGGLEEIRQNLIEAVEWPLKNPQMFKDMGVRPPKGILLYGPPGTGKTLLAKAVATESETNFILVKGAELLSKWVGDSEKGIKKTFERAKQVAPTVIFFDEIDALAPKRGLSSDNHVTERVVNQLLTEIDGLEELHDVVIIGATNRPDILDPALLRPGRFDRIILTPVPDEKARLKIFEIHTKGMPLESVNLKELVKKTENYVGADIEAVCREAAMHALRKDMGAKKITMEDFKEALKRIKSSITLADIKKYENIEDEYLRTARGAAIRNEVFTYTG
ncbi:MAG TPA: CDC48 family AAA ATPase [Candidatus Nanoarchaeia archaeon]|nr:CDC48 family AAA ATPase [Candidatus Nanoarchaeia archaeon]